MTGEFRLNGETLDIIPKRFGYKILGEKNIKQRVNMSDIPKDKEGKNG